MFEKLNDQTALAKELYPKIVDEKKIFEIDQRHQKEINIAKFNFKRAQF